MNQTQIYQQLIKSFEEKLPKFSDGRIDYSGSPEAPVVTVFVEYAGKLLLLKRSDKVSTYQGKWNTVAGYLDEPVPLEIKVLEELREEAGILEDDIASMEYGRPLTYEDTTIGRTWIIHPVLVTLKREPEITLDFEHTEYKWVQPEEIQHYDAVDNLDASFERIKNA